jgi:hypothetical protein
MGIVPSSTTTAGILNPPNLDPPPRGRCNDCGYDLRGILSPRCPECGAQIPILTPLSPEKIEAILSPVRWPISATKCSLIPLLLLQAVLLSRALLGMALLVLAYCAIMFPYWRRVHGIRKMAKIHAIHLPIRGTEKSMIWQTRCWFAIALLLTWYEVPQTACIAIEFPWLQNKARQLYEVEPLLAKHEWDRCGIHSVTELYVSPSGVYFNLGLKRMAYLDRDPDSVRGTYGWHHLWGKWWYHEAPDDFEYPWATINR